MTHAQIVERLFDLQKMVTTFTQIERQVALPTNPIRNENDTEHSFSLAMCAWYVASLYPHLKTDLVVKYSLIHDLVEVHAGDVMAIGRTEAQEAAKHAAEIKAFQQLKSEWEDFPDMISCIMNYEDQNDEEAKFVKALDKILPNILNIQTNGATWKEFNIKRSTIIHNKDKKTSISPEVNELWLVLKERLLMSDELFNKGNAD